MKLIGHNSWVCFNNHTMERKYFTKTNAFQNSFQFRAIIRIDTKILWEGFFKITIHISNNTSTSWRSWIIVATTVTIKLQPIRRRPWPHHNSLFMHNNYRFFHIKLFQNSQVHCSQWLWGNYLINKTSNPNPDHSPHLVGASFDTFHRCLTPLVPKTLSNNTWDNKDKNDGDRSSLHT